MQFPTDYQGDPSSASDGLSKCPILATMLDVEPYISPTHMPRIPTHALWINHDPLSDPDGFGGQVLLFDFWDYTCINCLRTLPYLREWHARYDELGFKLIGIHTPEFPFAEEPENVRNAVKRLGIRWPVMLDNDQQLWTAFANRYWPTKYLVDRQGYLRYRHPGEGGYKAVEAAIQELLQEEDNRLSLPDLLEPVREDDRPGAVCLPTTPELQADSLGNQAAPQTERSNYKLPASLEPGKYYLEGEWESVDHGYRLAGNTGRILLNYEASRCNAVLAPSDPGPDNTLESPGFISVEIYQDGEALQTDHFAEDVLMREDRTLLRVDVARMYALTHMAIVGPHTLSLNVKNPGLIFYAFSFESCASVQHSPQTHAEV